MTTIITPPHDEQAERAVIGSLLIDPEAIPAAAAILRADDFYVVKHQWMFEAITDLQRAGEAVDILTVGGALERAGQLAEIGGAGFIAFMAAEVETALNAETYARTVARYAQRRRMLAAASAIAKRAYDLAGDDDELPGAALAAITAATDRNYRPARDMGEVMETALAEFDRRRAHPGPNGPTFGIAALDKIVGGLEAGRLYVVAGRPGKGKSVLIMQAVMRAARAGKPAALFTLEMSSEEVLTRMAKAQAGIGYPPGGEASLTDDQTARLRAAYAEVASWPLAIHDRLPRLSQILAEAERLAARGALALLAVDYLQIVVPDAGKRDQATRDAELSAATRQLKALAMRLQVPVLIGSQLNRMADGVRPALSMLRESGGIESDADVVVGLWQPDEKVKAATEASVIKNRTGVVDNVQLYFDQPSHRFGQAVATDVVSPGREVKQP